MKKEAKLAQNFRDEIMKRFPAALYYKIPDSRSAGKRPFDAFLFCQGEFFAFEFKVELKKPTRYQEHCLGLVGKNRGRDFVVRNVNFYPTLERIKNVLKEKQWKQLELQSSR